MFSGWKITNIFDVDPCELDTIYPEKRSRISPQESYGRMSPTAFTRQTGTGRHETITRKPLPLLPEADLHGDFNTRR
jgi:hypothetical protein